MMSTMFGRIGAASAKHGRPVTASSASVRGYFKTGITFRYLCNGFYHLFRKRETELNLRGKGEPEGFVELTSYETGPNPVIRHQDLANDVGAVRNNASYAKISNIDVERWSPNVVAASCRRRDQPACDAQHGSRLLAAALRQDAATTALRQECRNHRSTGGETAIDNECFAGDIAAGVAGQQ
jgi:hypothetical protein